MYASHKFMKKVLELSHAHYPCSSFYEEVFIKCIHFKCRNNADIF